MALASTPKCAQNAVHRPTSLEMFSPTIRADIPYNVLAMRLIWKEHDLKFDFVTTCLGVAFVGAGSYGAALLVPHAVANPVVWVLAAVPLLFGMMGILILVREYQLWKLR